MSQAEIKGEIPIDPFEEMCEKVGQRPPLENLKDYQKLLLTDGELENSQMVGAILNVVDHYLERAIPRLAQEKLVKEGGFTPGRSQ